MTPEQITPAELTPEQETIADRFIELCGLEDVAEVPIIMNGQNGSVRYGLGRCSEYLMDKTPEEIKEMVMTQISETSRTD